MLSKEERAKHWSNGAEGYDRYIKQELSGFKVESWYKTLFDEELAAEEKRRHDENVAKYGDLRNHDSDTGETHDHVDPRELPLSNKDRPEWDVKKFNEMGLKDIRVLESIEERVYDEKDKLLFGATPMFMVKGVKRG